MLSFLKKSTMWALSIITIIFTFVPETCFKQYKLLENASDDKTIIMNRLLAFIIVLLLSIVFNALYLHFRNNIHIKGHNYAIQVSYGNLFDMHSCKKVINFDECFTTTIGDAPSQVKPNSICGQYLQNNPISDIQPLIEEANLKAARGKSEYQNKTRYDSGRLVPNGDFLLMAFAKLDKDGLGKFYSREEFLNCLSTLWHEIDKHYGDKDVCIPILGSGRTRMDGLSGTSLTQQELLDIIICSYKLSPYKIHPPHKLHIVCNKRDDFSLNKIDTTL